MIPIFTQDAVAKDIEACCTKCGESWHVIIAVSDGKISQVQCKSCYAYHRYRPIATERMTLTKNTRSSIAASTRKGSPAGTTRSASPRAAIPYVSANANPVQKYSLKSKGYRLGDRIEHVKFGIGIVDGFPAIDKMYVTFTSERVMLVFGK